MSKLETLIPAIREHLHEIAAQSDQNRAKELAEAETIIKTIPALIAQSLAGTSGECRQTKDDWRVKGVNRLNYAKVMGISLGHDWSYPDAKTARLNNRNPERDWLHTKARAVFEFCAKYGLQPKFLSFSGPGKHSASYDMMIEWDLNHIDRLLAELDRNREDRFWHSQHAG